MHWNNSSGLLDTFAKIDIPKQNSNSKQETVRDDGEEKARELLYIKVDN